MRYSNWLPPRAVFFALLLSIPCGLLADDAFDPLLVEKIAESALRDGNPARGAVIFAAPTSACLSCHQVGEQGGAVGPDLSQVGSKQKLQQIVESVLWPKRLVAPEYKAIAVLTADGQVVHGYKIRETDDEIEIRDSANNKQIVIAEEEIEDVRDVGTLMPDGLLATMSTQDQRDLVAFLDQLGKHDQLSAAAIGSLLSHSHAHHPVTFEVARRPLDPSVWPSWQQAVNRDRVYDFYAKQARHFRDVDPQSQLLAEFPGLDGGKYGHWGNQSEPTWADGRWNETDLGSVLSGVFHGDNVQVSRGVCIQFGDGETKLSACFDPDTLSYARVWKGGFIKFTSVRHGFMQGLNQDGTTVEIENQPLPYDKTLPHKYLGFYRHGPRVIFCYRVGEIEYLDAATISDGKFHRLVAPRRRASRSPLARRRSTAMA